ncbi:6607_t:CDS:10, partial [Entrophospora sp. SA101]
GDTSNADSIAKTSKKGVIHDIPRNLKELGYQINEKGQFLTLKGEIYNFEVKERAYNEALYDVIIGNLLLFRNFLMEWVEERLQNDFGLQEILLPINVTKDDIHSKIYVRYQRKKNRPWFLMWDGSMISYVKQAKEMGFPAIIINPNEVFWYKGKAVHTLPKTNVPFKIIMGSETPESHTNYVFENFVIVFEHVAKKLEQLENGATEYNDENEGDIEDGYLISEALKPIDLEIINESDLHAHNQAMKDVSSNETHFGTYIWIYQLLGELKRGVHALSIKAKTPKEINR